MQIEDVGSWRKPGWFASCSLVMILLCGGCAGGRLGLRSAAEPSNVLVGNFTHSIYGYDDHNNLHVVLIEGDPQRPTQAVHIRMYWQPRAGRTPIDEQATSAVVHYMVFTDEAAGVYSGAGFLFPQSRLGQGMFRGDLRNASVRLQDATEGFFDPLGLAIASGTFRAQRNDLGTHRAVRRLRMQLHERLGYPRLVGRDRGAILSYHANQ